MPSEQRLHPISILFAFAGSLKAFAVPGLLVLVAGRSSSGGADGGFVGVPANWEVWMMLFLIPAAEAPEASEESTEESTPDASEEPKEESTAEDDPDDDKKEEE